MRPIAILSSDLEPDYLFLLPIVCKSWELQGFDVELYVSGHNRQVEMVAAYCNLDTVHLWGDEAEPVIQSTNSKLYTQCVRLYMPRAIDPERYCILSDADMFIGSSFLYRDFDKVNVFGWDLTGYGQVPMCYVGMTARKWAEVMNYRGGNIETDLALYANKDSGDWYKAWGADQDILTGKLKQYGQHNWNIINRGHDNANAGLPTGRWDRHNWQKPSGEIHDVHLMRNPFSDTGLQRISEMINICYPKEDWTWIYEYRNKFINAT